ADCNYSLTFQSSGLTTGKDFGNYQQATRSEERRVGKEGSGGRKDGEGRHQGWTIYVDYNNNGTHDQGEPSDVTDAQGNYDITGINPSQWPHPKDASDCSTCVFPSDLADCNYSLTFQSSGLTTGKDFGNYQQAT